MLDFAIRLTKAIEEAGINQRILAKKTGLTEQSISRYANGTRVPKATDVKLIVEALQIDANELLGIAKMETTASDKTKISVSDILLQLNILENDLTLPVSECMEYHHAKIIVEKIYKKLESKAECRAECRDEQTLTIN